MILKGATCIEKTCEKCNCKTITDHVPAVFGCDNCEKELVGVNDAKVFYPEINVVYKDVNDHSSECSNDPRADKIFCSWGCLWEYLEKNKNDQNVDYIYFDCYPPREEFVKLLETVKAGEKK